jgi:carboxyl-terminal processing protease
MSSSATGKGTGKIGESTVLLLLIGLDCEIRPDRTIFLPVILTMANKLKSRWIKFLVLCSVVVAAFCITFIWPKQNALDFDIDSSPRVQAARARLPYDLSQVRVLKAVITRINQDYVEPQRVVPRKMLLAGLNAIQRSIAPVMVQYRNSENEFTIQVDNKKREFRASDVNSPWALTWRFQEIFKFLQEHLEDQDVKLRDIEYTAVNGMLQTLDPHSILLKPEEFEEMQLNTSGEFGGLGIVISIRDGQLTIIRPMPRTPASNAGLKAGDRILKIDEESTMNMPLEEAVKRLRGEPGSNVAVWVVREGAHGWTKPKRFDLERAVIHIESVESQMLAGHIGLLRIKSFQSNTCDDAKQALSNLHRDKMRGLILDLRDNPGGLLQQAVCIADEFIASGTIVTTASNDPEKQERKLAHAEGTEPSYPMIALVNGGSASASEIVAGALQSHDRALIVGQKTFGKGSVQELYSDETDKWALKLTVAQYLTPGDVSIQGVGIVPDVAIDPMTVDKLDMDLTVNKQYIRESDLTAHLTHARARESIKPTITLNYYLPTETRRRLQEANPEDLEENQQEDEFLTRFSRDLLARAMKAERTDMLKEAAPVIEQARVQEMARAEKELQKLGVDWTLGQDKGASELQVKVSTNRPENRAKAGEPFDLQVEISNKGQVPLYQLRAVTKSDNLLFQERELIFGQLLPGETRKWATTLGLCRSKNDKGSSKDADRQCRLPRSMPSRADGIRVEFSEAHGHVPPPVEVRTTIDGLPKPQFAYFTHLSDNLRGNGDGLLQRGESATLFLVIRNVGQGKSFAPLASLRNLSGRGILLRDGRFQLSDLNPGEQRVVGFTFEVLPDFDQPEAKLQVSINDLEVGQSSGEKLHLPIYSGSVSTLKPFEGKIGLKEGAVIRERPEKDGRVVAHVQAGNVTAQADQSCNGFKRIDLGNKRWGWIADQQIVDPSRDSKGRVVEYFDHMPPRLEIETPPLVTREQSIKLQGKASDDIRVRDLYVFVGTRKLYYQSNGDSDDRSHARFSTSIQLRPGINYVSVFARESEDTVARHLYVVRQDAPDGSLLETPKTDGELFFEEGE